MTDDLVNRLRAAGRAFIDNQYNFHNRAADEIERLRAALREIAAGYETEWSTSTMGNMFDVAQILSERISIARKALEGKDD